MGILLVLTRCMWAGIQLSGWELLGQGELVHQAPWEAFWAPWRWIQGQGRYLKGPLQHILALLPCASAESPYQGKEQGSSSLRWKHLPALPKPLMKNTGLFLLHNSDWLQVSSYTLYGGKVVPLSCIRFFVLICATEMYKNALFYWALYIIKVNFWRQSCFQGIPQERGDKKSNPHVCCAVGGTGIPHCPGSSWTSSCFVTARWQGHVVP